MSFTSASALKVIYNLRPAKQIERRMLVDAFQMLAVAGFRLREYQYTGMGSIYFIDYILLHKLLGITDLLSAEYDRSLESRVHFNRPFELVRVTMLPIGDVIPTLDPRKRHLLWLDYDFRLDSTVIEDVSAAAYQLSAGSILLVTVDVKPPHGEGPADWRQYYEESAEVFFEFDWTTENFGASSLPGTTALILRNAIRAGLAPDTEFFPLFNFLYADGHPMLTIGGVIGGAKEAEALNRCNFDGASFIRRDLNKPPYEIAVPRLTPRERAYLDWHMPASETWLPTEFTLSAEDVAKYRDVYRFYPSFVEMIV